MRSDVQQRRWPRRAFEDPTPESKIRRRDADPHGRRCAAAGAQGAARSAQPRLCRHVRAQNTGAQEGS